MKYFTRSKQYRASNVYFDTVTESAWSYEWYCMAKRINGRMVLNNYNYSNSTIKHVSKVWLLFTSLGIEFDTIECPRGLQNLDSATVYYQNKIASLQAEIMKRCSQAKKNMERTNRIAHYQGMIEVVQGMKHAESVAA